MRRSSVALSLVCAGCFYMPHSYDSNGRPFPGKRVQLTCLDLAVSLVEDPHAPSPVIAYSFGNHCTHATVVDLGSVRVIGGDPLDPNTSFRAYDPKGEIEPLRIDPWWNGYEEIAYQGFGERVCAEVGHVERVPDATDHWVCLSASEGLP